ncbi:MAG TPA: RagB/SusD family nutrient uptake outer membrane protein [Longimicrobium sp.]|nr:RagB/SusD family nutrient uptake outer membrane protein [Longimicrobium sp.]
MNHWLSRQAGARLLRGGVLLAAALATAGCELDLTDPNAPREEEVLGSPELVLTTAVGIQAQMAENIHIFVRAPALVTDEWGVRQRALESDRSLVTGTVDPAFGSVSDPFAAAYRIGRTADLLMAAAPRVELSPALQTGTIALSKLMKAMALGYLTTQYEQLPLDDDTAGAAPVPRDQVRDEVIAILESARSDLGSVTDAQLSDFNTRVLSGGLNLRNTVDAMLARYYLFDGQYQNAITAAQRVNLGVLSQLTYPNPGVNPIQNYGFGLDYVGARRVLFTEAQAGDQRPAYWAVRTGVAGQPDSVFNFNRYGGRNDAFPVYLPDEMRLIQAEAYTRLGQLNQARPLVNAVRTQCSSTVAEPLACMAALPVEALDTEAELLTEILYQRRYELFAQGVRWEDLRRLSAYTAKRPSIQFLPYPTSECQRNPNSGCFTG